MTDKPITKKEKILAHAHNHTIEQLSARFDTRRDIVMRILRQAGVRAKDQNVKFSWDARPENNPRDYSSRPDRRKKKVG